MDETGHSGRALARLARRFRVSRPRSRRCPSRHSERGETLIETLCTLTIVSLGIVALVVAMGYSFRFDRQSRASAQSDTLMVAFAENLQSLTYEACSGGSTPYSSS